MTGADLKVPDAAADGTDTNAPPRATPTTVVAPALASPPSNVPKPDWLASIAHAAVIATAAVYVAGFGIAVPHYLRRTVPVRALTHDTFIGAGVLFWILTATAVAVGAALAKTKPGRVGFSRIDLVLWPGFLSTIAIMLGGPGGLRALLYVAIVVVLTILARHRLSVPARDAHILVLVDWYGRELTFFVGLVWAFGLLVYPRATPNFGGGGEQLLATVTIPNEAPTSETDAWQKFSCRRFPSPVSAASPVCRRFYRVHETTDSIYIGIGEWPGLCDHTPTARPLWLSDTERRCVRRVANSLLPHFEVDEGVP